MGYCHLIILTFKNSTELYCWIQTYDTVIHITVCKVMEDLAYSYIFKFGVCKANANHLENIISPSHFWRNVKGKLAADWLICVDLHEDCWLSMHSRWDISSESTSDVSEALWHLGSDITEEWRTRIDELTDACTWRVRIADIADMADMAARMNAIAKSCLQEVSFERCLSGALSSNKLEYWTVRHSSHFKPQSKALQPENWPFKSLWQSIDVTSSIESLHLIP